MGSRDRAAALVKVALFSPMPPERSGIADYTALLLPALRDRCDVVPVRHGSKRPPRGTDLAVYHVGNDPEAHGWIVDALRRTPGVVVLHDFVLHHLVAGLTIGYVPSPAVTHSPPPAPASWAWPRSCLPNCHRPSAALSRYALQAAWVSPPSSSAQIDGHG